MSLLSRGLIAFSVLGSIAAGLSVLARPAVASAESDFEMSCGVHHPGVPGVVVVQLVPKGKLRHGQLTLLSELQEPEGPGKAGPGEIDVELNMAPGPIMCGSIAPSAFLVRGTSEQLTGKTLRVTSAKPVRVEIQDRTGKVVSVGVADPALGKGLQLVW